MLDDDSQTIAGSSISLTIDNMNGYTIPGSKEGEFVSGTYAQIRFRLVADNSSSVQLNGNTTTPTTIQV